MSQKWLLASFLVREMDVGKPARERPGRLIFPGHLPKPGEALGLVSWVMLSLPFVREASTEDLGQCRAKSGGIFLLTHHLGLCSFQLGKSGLCLAFSGWAWHVTATCDEEGGFSWPA